MASQTPLNNRVAIVTGGSRGIGAATCAWLVGHGATVWCIYKDNDAAAEQLRERLGAAAERLFPVRLDVTDSAGLAAAVAAVIGERDRLDVLVNAAGGPFDGLFLRSNAASTRSALALNLESAITSARAALPTMLKQRYGRIVNVSSVVASIGNSGQSIYGAAKAGLEGFSRSLAREVGHKGVTVNCVAPGFIDTDMTAGLNDAVRERILIATAVGRPGTPEEVAHAIGFLCREESAFITGTVLQVNGGMYM